MDQSIHHHNHKPHLPTPHTQVWTARLGRGYKVACIGETTATAAREQGWEAGRIYYPQENPGIDGWAAAVVEALGKEGS